MKYTKEEAFEEVMKRSRVLKRRNEKKKTALLSASASLVTVTLVLMIGVLGGAGAGISGQSAYGSFLLPTEAGGYILAAVVAFVIGIGVTLIIQKYRKDHGKKS